MVTKENAQAGVKQPRISVDENGFRTDLAAHMMTLAARVIRPLKGAYDSENSNDNGFELTIDKETCRGWVAQFTAGFGSEMRVRVQFADSSGSTGIIDFVLTNDLEVQIELDSLEYGY